MPDNLVTIEAMVLGAHRISITGSDEKDAVKRISLFSSLPDKCPKCGAVLFFTYRKVAAKGDKKGGTFYGVKCRGAQPHEKYFHVHDNEAQSLYWVEREEFQIAFTARQQDEQGQDGGTREQWDDYDGGTPPTKQSTQPVGIAPITDDTKREIAAWLKSKGLSPEWAQEEVKGLFGGRKIGELTEPQGKQVIPALERSPRF